MKVSVIGVGYVGLVTGACLAELGHEVICMDQDAQKIAQLQAGKLPIYEPGLAQIVARNAAAGRLEFTTDLAEAVRRSLVIFIAVGTPSDEDGSADLGAFWQVLDRIAAAMDGYRVIVGKSTVPAGTALFADAILEGKTRHPYAYVSNPEFLKEGSAVEDFLQPDRVIIGTYDRQARQIMRELYAPCMRREDRLLFMDAASAELSKYAANAMLATRISFMNELSRLCEEVGADIEKVRAAVGSDSRIGPAFLYAGVGFGGSCFPKDVRALLAQARYYGCPLEIVQATLQANHRQRQRFTQLLLDYGAALEYPATMAVWGLAFKARTDDVRESPALYCIKHLCASGRSVRVHDPEAMPTARTILGEQVIYCSDPYEALRGADALVVLTDWPQFRAPDLSLIAQSLRRPVLFDGRNLYDPAQVRAAGLQYFGIGR